jgi:protein involved in polysaccharide export with SLBB domain
MLFPSLKTSFAAIIAFGLSSFCLFTVAEAQTAPMPPPSVPSASAPVTPSPNSVDVLPGDYQLAPDDQIDITVEGHTEFDKSVTILPNGTFSYFGKTVQAADHSQDALAQILTHDLKDQLRYPQVTVSVRLAHVRQISVIGTAHAPGMYAYRPGMKILDAIASSGGPLQAPELTDATLVTNLGTTNQPVDLVKLMSGTDPSLNVPLQPGDILSMQARNPAQSMVLIRGQVGHEGQYTVRPEGATILAMLTQAGGMTPSAAVTRVQLTHDGVTHTLNLRPTLFDTTVPVGQTQIVAGDTIAVPLNNTKYMVLGEVNNRGVFALPDGEPVTVTRAMAQAGGPTNDADMKNVQIVRSVPDGNQSKLTYIPVNVDDILHNKKNGADPVLQDGDILYFPKRVHGGNTTNAIQNGIGSLFTFGALSNLLHL